MWWQRKWKGIKWFSFFAGPHPSCPDVPAKHQATTTAWFCTWEVHASSFFPKLLQLQANLNMLVGGEVWECTSHCFQDKHGKVLQASEMEARCRSKRYSYKKGISTTESTIASTIKTTVSAFCSWKLTSQPVSTHLQKRRLKNFMITLYKHKRMDPREGEELFN